MRAVRNKSLGNDVWCSMRLGVDVVLLILIGSLSHNLFEFASLAFLVVHLKL